MPPMRSLVVFEVVVRLGRFAAAAEELGITQSAVSQHVKLVEQWIGRRLLIRGARGTRATQAGKALAEAVASGTQTITDACQALREPAAESQRLVIASLPGFAVKWLFPRLLDFDTLYPAIGVSITTDTSPVRFVYDTADCVIHYGLGHHPDLHVDKLFGERLFPVMSPTLQASGHPLSSPADLRHHTILVDEIHPIQGKQPGWHTWLAHVDQAIDILVKSRRFGQSNMVIQAAVEGMGVALGRDPLVQDDLLAGTLVQPFTTVVDSDFAYYFVCPQENLQLERVRVFRDWLLTTTDRFHAHSPLNV